MRNVLLGLKLMYGAHSGVAIAEEMLATMREFKVSDRIGYFVADNASNNDCALREIAKEIDIDPARQRVRCSAHIINLVAKAILYGTDTDCVADAAGTVSQPVNITSGASPMASQQTVWLEDDSTSLVAWRKKGAFGRCHNLIYHVKGSPRRRRYFESK